VTGTIVCVDDEAIILLSLKQELLRKYGGRFSYETALGAEEALGIIDETMRAGARIDLVITDWIMPGMRGDAFIERVSAILPEVPVIVLSGQAEESCVDELKSRCRVVAYLEKPHRAGDLFDVIHREVPAPG
jgi:DNA-binding NtrC family response regulator